MTSARACTWRPGAVSVSAVGLIALAVGLLATGVIVGSIIVRQSEAERDRAAAAGNGVIPASAQAANPASSQAPPKTSVAGLPPIQFDPPVVDLGIIKPSESFSREVSLINTSDAPLKILYSRASCTCTSVDLADTVIPPGGSVPLKIRYDSQTTLGQKRSVVRVAAEGYDEVTSIAIRAEVSLTIHSLPSYIRASEVTSGVVSLESLDGRPYTVLAVNGEPPNIIEDADAGEGPRSHYRLRWDFSAYDVETCRDPQGRRVPEWLAVETDHPECPIFDIYVRHPCTVPMPPTGARKWLPSERHALVGALEPGETAEYTIGLKWLGRVEPDDMIHTVSSDSDQFNAELVDTRRTVDLIELTIRITPTKGHRGLFYGDVWLHASLASAPMTVIGTVREDLVRKDTSG